VRWLWRFHVGVPGRVRLADVDGDGVEEILVGGDVSSDQSTCRILSHHGAMKWELPVEGWTSRLTALDWRMDADGGRAWLACGASRGNNLHLYELQTASPGASRSLFGARLGGAVTAVGFAGGDARALYVGTSQGYLCAYAFSGDKLWVKYMEHGIGGIFVMQERLVVCENDGRLHLLTAAGEAVAVGAGAPASSGYLQQSGALYAAAGREIRRNTFGTP